MKFNINTVFKLLLFASITIFIFVSVNYEFDYYHNLRLILIDITIYTSVISLIIATVYFLFYSFKKYFYFIVVLDFIAIIAIGPILSTKYNDYLISINFANSYEVARYTTEILALILSIWVPSLIAIGTIFFNNRFSMKQDVSQNNPCPMFKIYTIDKCRNKAQKTQFNYQSNKEGDNNLEYVLAIENPTKTNINYVGINQCKIDELGIIFYKEDLNKNLLSDDSVNEKSILNIIFKLDKLPNLDEFNQQCIIEVQIAKGYTYIYDVNIYLELLCKSKNAKIIRSNVNQYLIDKLAKKF